MERLLTYEDILNANSLKELSLKIHDSNNNLGKTELFEIVSKEWQNLCWNRLSINEITKKTPTYEPIVIEHEGIIYNIFEVAHSFLGGGSREYRRFVADGLKDKKPILFEKMTEKMFPPMHDNYAVIPDFKVLKPLDSFSLGFYLTFNPLNFLRDLKEMCTEYFRKTAPNKDAHEFLDNIWMSPYYHNIDPMLRRGIGGFLPPTLQEEYSNQLCNDIKRFFPGNNQMDIFPDDEKPRWEKWRKYHRMNRFMAINPRSAYMVEFSKAFCKYNNIKEINIVVGETHNTDMEYFFKNPTTDQRLINMGQDTGNLTPKELKSHYRKAMIPYLGSSILGMTAGSAPYIAIIINLTN